HVLADRVASAGEHVATGVDRVVHGAGDVVDGGGGDVADGADRGVYGLAQAGEGVAEDVAARGVGDAVSAGHVVHVDEILRVGLCHVDVDVIALVDGAVVVAALLR